MERKRNKDLWVGIIFLICCAVFGVVAGVIYDHSDTLTNVDALH